MLLDLPLHEPPLSLYMEAFYGGRIDPHRLRAGRYVLLECSSCRLLYQRDIPRASLLIEIYDSPVHAEVTRSRSPRDRAAYASQIESLLAYLRLPSRDVRVLDYGAGLGDWLSVAAGRGCVTFAAELSSDKSRRLAAAGHEILHPDALPPGTFHMINAEQVFEHLVAPHDAARCLVAALRPGGILRISVPNGKPVVARLADADWMAPKGSRRSLNAVAPLEHINCYRLGSLRRLGCLAGARPFAYPILAGRLGQQGALLLAQSIRHRLRSPRGLKVLFARP